MHENELTPEEVWRYMPKWKKALGLIVFFGGGILACIQF